MIKDYAALKVGDAVAVARYGTWNISNQGIYVVVKVDKIKVVVQRVGDNYERSFSVRKRHELGVHAALRNDTFLEAVEDQTARAELRRRDTEIANMWRQAEAAAAQRNFDKLKSMVDQLALIVEPKTTTPSEQ